MRKKKYSVSLEDGKNTGLILNPLVIWGGEFGRTPHAQGDGRDHNNKGYSIWMAGGGCKGGFTYALPMTTAMKRLMVEPISMTGTRQFSICWDWTTKN